MPLILGGAMKQLLLVLLVCMSLVMACNKGPQTQAAREPEPTMTSSDLKSQVEMKLNSDAQLRAANLSVSADADRNMVTLSGTVDSEMLRTRAVDMAKAVHPGLKVEDKIDVKPREIGRAEYTPEQARAEVERAKTRHETVGGTADDAWI